MFKKLRGVFSNDLSIDLGTANTLIYVKIKGSSLTNPQLSPFAKSAGTPNRSLLSVMPPSRCWVVPLVTSPPFAR